MHTSSRHASRQTERSILINEKSKAAAARSCIASFLLIAQLEGNPQANCRRVRQRKNVRFINNMPKKEEFVLKDCDPEFIKAAGVQPRGREYDASCAKKPGAVRIDEVLLGTKLACIAITDDHEGTLAKVGKMNPWHIEALKMITGSEEEAHKPLTHILDKYFNLKCDKILDLSGWSGGHPIDTQGYIAHNDEMIVVAFRCTTSALDWMTNLATTSSEWELDEDVAQGHSGFLSCFEGRCFVKGPKKPRVHTGMCVYLFLCAKYATVQGTIVNAMRQAQRLSL